MGRQVGLDDQDEHCTQKDNAVCTLTAYVDVTGRALLSESRSHHL